MASDEEALEIDAAIGFAVRSWSNVEVTLSILLAELAHTDMISGLVISSALDFKHRKNIVLALAELKLNAAPELQRRLKQNLKKVEKLGLERNRFVHGMLAHNPSTGEPQTITLRTAQRFFINMQKVSADDAMATAEGLNRAANEFIEIASAAASVVRQWHRSSDIPPPPYLQPQP